LPESVQQTEMGRTHRELAIAFLARSLTNAKTEGVVAMNADAVRITLVEDNAAESSLFCSLATEIAPGTQIHVFSTAEEALPYLSANDTDMVIVDLNLAAMNGHQLLSRVRSFAHHRRTPVVVMSASQNPADRESALAYGAARFVLKSMDLEETERQFKDLLGFARKHRSLSTR